MRGPAPATPEPCPFYSPTCCVPFADIYLDQLPKRDGLWAALCIMGAMYFILQT